MNTYNWQQPDWPRFRYDLSGMEESLFLIAEKQMIILIFSLLEM